MNKYSLEISHKCVVLLVNVDIKMNNADRIVEVIARSIEVLRIAMNVI